MSTLLLVAAGCRGGAPTVSYACVPSCPAGFRCTETGCVSDAPPPDLSMEVGADLAATCQPACSGPTPHCSGSQCVPCLIDAHCPAGQVCSVRGATSLCVPGCQDDGRCAGEEPAARCCAGQCIDTSTDSLNCGGCGVACDPPHAAATCVAGACVPGACSAGWADCNHEPADGCEANTLVDTRNCGACQTTCAIAHAVAGCAGACYIAACSFGFDDCNADPVDGCETSVLSDPKNCGTCGMGCTKPAHGASACVNAACQLSRCDVGWGDCDANVQNGCETNLFTDAASCGGCGAACGLGLVCRNGGCTCPQCNFPNASSKCVNNVCVLDQCVAGFADCDGNPVNGCEVDTTSDANNCKGCGMVCPNGETCASGVCTNLYMPNGVQMNVPVANLAGWTLCYHDTYNVNMQAQLPAIKAACNQSKLLLACRPNNAPTLTLLAWGQASDVTFDTGAGANQGHTVGQVVWYFNSNWSWGFATAGDQLALNQCDVNAGSDRLCWHTVNGAGGYRCGGATGLNGDGSWDRLIYQAP